MKKRKLYIANTPEGKIHIDSIDKEQLRQIPEKGNAGRVRYTCPYCGAEVIPKMGEKNIWHFSHKGGLCSQFLGAQMDDGKNKRLDLSGVPTIKLSDIQLGEESAKFLCVKCKRTFNKASGHRWEANEYICEECFQKL